MKHTFALKEDVQRLALADGRMVGTPGHETARRYLIERFRELGLVPYVGDSFCLSYSGTAQEFTNLVGVVRGRDSASPPVLVGAHYDSVIAAPCADDNAAAVAIALGAAGALRERNLERDVVIALFDAEEPPYFLGENMGSVRFHDVQMRDEGIHATIIMDLVGHDMLVPFRSLEVHPLASALGRMCPGFKTRDLALPVIRDFLFVTGAESHPALPHILGNVRPSRALRPIATLNKYIGDVSDHGVFRRNRVPYLFFSCGRWPHYHMESDTPDRLNYRKMGRIMDYLVRIVETLSGTKLESFPKPADTTAFEIEMLERASGPLLRRLLPVLGISQLENRADIDALAQALIGTGL